MESSRHLSVIYSADPFSKTPNPTLLTQRIALEELKSVVEDMEEDKTPGPDRFSARVIKICCDNVHNDLLKMVLKSQHCEKNRRYQKFILSRSNPQRERCSLFRQISTHLIQ